MSLSLYDSEILSAAIKTARHKKHLTQAACAELLDYSLSFQKDLERGRCSPSIESFYQICRTLNMSADSCIFPESQSDSPAYRELLQMLSLCNERQLRVLSATASALLSEN